MLTVASWSLELLDMGQVIVMGTNCLLRWRILVQLSSLLIDKELWGSEEGERRSEKKKERERERGRESL